MAYGWIITDGNKFGREFDEEERRDGCNCVIGQAGPYDLTEEMFRELQDGGGIAFKMSCDDEEMVFTGRMILDEYSDEFAPLDDYGTPSLGFTKIWVRNKNNEWEMV